MFKKQYKVKTNTTIKGSDKRRLRTVIESTFPALTSEEIGHLISNKTDIHQTKAMTNSGTILMIYSIGQNPMFFQVEDKCYPTVYTLWKYPQLLPTVVTIPNVLSKIINGADLMAPGVVITDETILEMSNLVVNGMCSVRIAGNVIPVAVGYAVMSKDELCTDNVKGKAVVIVHSYKDTLWETGNQSDPPLLPEPRVEVLENSETLILLPVCEAGGNEPEGELAEVACQEDDTSDAISELKINDVEFEEEEDAAEENVPEFTMDEILHHAFMTAIKTNGKTIELPVPTSTFYSAHVLKCCPSSLHLDIKKTSYKKLSTFLKKMQKEGVIQIKEFSKGAESITVIKTGCEMVVNYQIHELFQRHLIQKKKTNGTDLRDDGIDNYKFPTVSELFVISAQVKTLFEKFKYKKGESIHNSTIRDVLKNYVKENSLQNETNRNEITLDPILTDCVCTKGNISSTMNWEELHNAITSKMPHAYEVTFEGKDPILKKGKLEPIIFTVDTRTGNKKVTLIYNLETYGIDYEKLSHHVQVAVAASTSILPTQNGKGVILMIQGNQLKYLQKLFLENYKVPRKYLQGLENASKKKK